ncbi:MAG: hypothetical protein KAH86_07565, partial [Methanosarcinales archaeon]|nr:hypothetical protein [Methanosarcinales archaeon]
NANQCNINGSVFCNRRSNVRRTVGGMLVQKLEQCIRRVVYDACAREALRWSFAIVCQPVPVVYPIAQSSHRWIQVMYFGIRIMSCESWARL